MQIELGELLLPSTLVVGNTIDISGLPIDPDFMFFSWVNASVETGPARITTRFGFGFTGGAGLDGHIEGYRQDSADPYRTKCTIRTDSCISSNLTPAGGYGLEGAVKFNAWITGGVRLECVDDFSHDVLVKYQAVSGIGQFDVHTLTEPATAGDQIKTALGFAPGSLFLLATSMTAIDTGGGPFLLSIGCATGIEETEQAVLAGIERDALGFADSTTYNRDGEVVCLFPDSANPTPNARASVTQMVQGGYTLNWAERAGSRIILVLALEASLELGTLLTQTNTNPFTEAYNTSPAAILFFSNTEAESTQDAGPTGLDCAYSIGAAIDPSNRWCVGSRGTGDGATGASGIGQFIRSRSVYFNFNASDSVDGEMDIDAGGLGASEMALVMDDADPSQAFVWYVIFPSVELDTRARLLRYHENAHVSRLLGRTQILDPFGREVPIDQVQVDEWIRSDGAFMPTSRKFATLALDPAVGYIESVDERRDQLRITVAREALFAGVMSRLARGG